MLYATNKLRLSTYLCTPSGNHKSRYIGFVELACVRKTVIAVFREFIGKLLRAAFQNLGVHQMIRVIRKKAACDAVEPVPSIREIWELVEKCPSAHR